MKKEPAAGQEELIRIFDGHIKQNYPDKHKILLSLEGDPLTMFDPDKRKIMQQLYDDLLRSLSDHSGLVVYKGKKGNQTVKKCNFDLSLSDY